MEFGAGGDVLNNTKYCICFLVLKDRSYMEERLVVTAGQSISAEVRAHGMTRLMVTLL